MDEQEKLIPLNLPLHVIEKLREAIRKGTPDDPAPDELKLEQLDATEEPSETLPNDTIVEEPQSFSDHRLKKFYFAIKEALARDCGEAILLMKKLINSDKPVFDNVILLLERYNRIQKNFQKGLIDFPTADGEMNKMANAILYFINEVSEEDLAD